MHAGVDAGVAVSQGCARDVHAVGAEVDGAAGVDEVVDTNAALGGKVPNAGVGVGAVVLFVIGWAAEGWVFVIGPEETTSGLTPERKMLCAGQVPAKDDGCDGHPGKGAAYDVEGGADGRGPGRVGAEGALELGGVGLPERKGFACQLEVAAEGAVAVAGGDDFANVHTCHEELEAVAVFSEAVTALNENADLEGEMIGVDVEGCGVVVGYYLS